MYSRGLTDYRGIFNDPIIVVVVATDSVMQEGFCELLRKYVEICFM